MQIISTNIAKQVLIPWRGKQVKTGIYKTPINKPVYLGTEDVKDDVVSDRRVHGGIFKACYLFSADYYEYWENLYPNLDWYYGMLGENLSVKGLDETKRDLENDKVVQELISHGKHKNLSFFAFTATPKEKTLQLFGHEQKDGTFRPFHIYSMRQAIEEGFILDVLKNYMTYNTYYKIAKKIDQDPELDSSRASAAVAKFQSLHPIYP